MAVALMAIAMLGTPMFPAVSADLTGYTAATYGVQWNIADWGVWKGVAVEEGIRWWRQIEIASLTDSLNEAKARIVITKVRIGGVDHTDQSTIEANLAILNAEKITPKQYLIDLGTIKPGHTRKALLNVLCSQPLVFWFVLSVWYVP